MSSGDAVYALTKLKERLERKAQGAMEPHVIKWWLMEIEVELLEWHHNERPLLDSFEGIGSRLGPNDEEYPAS